MVASKINLIFIEQYINTTISKTTFIDKRNYIQNYYFLNINNSLFIIFIKMIKLSEFLVLKLKF